MRRILLVLSLMIVQAAPALGTVQRLETGTGVFNLSVPIEGAATTLRVFYVRPRGYRPDTPVVIVMHGLKRNAGNYRDNWIELAERHNFLVLAPEFTKRDFPKSRAYNLGNVFAQNGAINPSGEWSFSRIKRVFEKARALTGSICRTYGIFGHSAGGQFVHRMVMLLPRADIDVAIAANAGWYTLPLFSVEWPYGLGTAPLTNAGLRTALSRKLIVLLGEKDTDANHKYLRKTRQAMAQGPHRLARGRYFYATAKQEAKRLGAPFNWEKITVKDVGHSNRAMAKRAAARFALRSTCKKEP